VAIGQVVLTEFGLSPVIIFRQLTVHNPLHIHTTIIIRTN